MSELVESLVPKAVKKLIPYQSARRIGGSGRIWLNANELEQSLFPNEENGTFNRYPDFLPQDIASAYNAYIEGDAETVAVRGADEAIDLLIRTFCQPGHDRILICSPTYAMYEFCADALAINTLDVPLLSDFNLNVDEIIRQSQNANIVFLCSPNNPTGNLIPRSDIVSVLEGTKASSLVVVDEAYIEFELQESVSDLVEAYPHLVVIRTLSKAFGLAAVRCGFILASAAVMKYVSKLIPPYPMPDSSASIVLSALTPEGIQTMREATQTLIETREWFIEALSTFECIEHVYPSSTNFVLLKVQHDIDLFSVLLNNGIVTRNQSHEPALKQCVRITIGTKESMLEVIETLTNYTKTSTVNTK
ncbi:histidinol-phosphate transaminase [Vibrio amylolyticus]|uniref:histidinol-phosphate transaminase n=1 Tax=Vibrio amylolyticus TaxID=2847292 RepID=UPI0035512766